MILVDTDKANLFEVPVLIGGYGAVSAGGWTLNRRLSGYLECAHISPAWPTFGGPRRQFLVSVFYLPCTAATGTRSRSRTSSSTICENLLSYFCAIPKSQFNFIYVRMYLSEAKKGRSSPPPRPFRLRLRVRLEWNCWRKLTTKPGTQLRSLILCPRKMEVHASGNGKWQLDPLPCLLHFASLCAK